ncbi:MAG: cytochrome b N-terminal domain-containing protein [Desulforhopalus sp.]
MLLLPESLHRNLSTFSRHSSALKEIKWGAWALISFYISMLSGIIVGLQYDYLNPFYSTTAIDLLAPYGRFFRSIHFFSSQFFFFFCCFHLVATYHKTIKYSKIEWLRLMTSLPLIILLLFTGYVLRGDNTGTSAGIIAENIMQAIPVIGPSLNDILFSLSESGLRKVYIHHVIALDLLLLIFAWNHLRIYRVVIREHLLLIASILIFSVFISAPFEPDRLGISYISGPWFFLGLQELLRYFPPLIAGVVVPGLFVAGLFAIHPAYKYSRIIIIMIGFSLLCYTFLTCIAWNR